MTARRLDRKIVFASLLLFPTLTLLALVIVGLVLSFPDAIYLYLMAFCCSSPYIWSTLFAGLVISQLIAFRRVTPTTLAVASLLGFGFFCLPLVLVLTGVIEYCGP